MIIEKGQEEKLLKALDVFLQGNIDAVRFCKDLITLVDLWDDLVDKDKEKTNDEINDVFRIALINIPLNPFYQKFQGHLIPLIMNCILQWEDANKMEKSVELSDKHQAFMLKASAIQIISYCAFIIGGMDWSREIGIKIRKLYNENLEDFMKEG